eukprot:PLAT14036.2.p1 GENE.PLAT14036.2~~PLAT14036.2.p1  ORF type:complete len:611 (+),score=311.74 PLAT14036.2:43-1875(+)
MGQKFALHKALAEQEEEEAVLSLITKAADGIFLLRSKESDLLPLHIAIAKGYSGTVVSMLLNRAPTSAAERGLFGRLPLSQAAHNGDTSAAVIAALLAAHPAAARDSEGGKLPMFAALEAGHGMAVIEQLAAATGELDASSGDVVRTAIKSGAAASAVRFLLTKQPSSLTVADAASGQLLLHFAMKARAAADIVLGILSSHRGAAAIADKEGSLPLHYALSEHHDAAVVKAVLDTCPGAVAHKNAAGWTPLHVALMSSAFTPTPIEVIERLCLAWAGGVRTAGRGGRLPLHLALLNKGSLDIVRLLLQRAPDTATAADNDGNLPLHMALYSNRDSGVVREVLLAAPGAVKARNEFGVTPLQHARDTWKAARRHDCSVFPLHEAAEADMPVEWVTLLINAYPDAVLEKTVAGKRASQLARSAVVKELLEETEERLREARRAGQPLPVVDTPVLWVPNPLMLSHIAGIFPEELEDSLDAASVASDFSFPDLPGFIYDDGPDYLPFSVPEPARACLRLHERADCMTLADWATVQWAYGSPDAPAELAGRLLRLTGTGPAFTWYVEARRPTKSSGFGAYLVETEHRKLVPLVVLSYHVLRRSRVRSVRMSARVA